jgi:hypothetical protein
MFFSFFLLYALLNKFFTFLNFQVTMHFLTISTLLFITVNADHLLQFQDAGLPDHPDHPEHTEHTGQLLQFQHPDLSRNILTCLAANVLTCRKVSFSFFLFFGKKEKNKPLIVIDRSTE